MPPIDDLPPPPAPSGSIDDLPPPPSPPKEPNIAPLKNYLADNLKAWQTAQNIPSAGNAPGTEIPGSAPATADGSATNPSSQKPPEVADTFIKSLEAGWQMSTTGLGLRGQMPDLVPPEHAGMAYRIATQAASLAGDLPAMAAGGIVGGIAGSEVPVIGNVMGMAAGAWSAPAAIRRMLMDHYQKGDIQNFQDFWERGSGAFMDALKAGTVGALTEGVGGAATGVLKGVGASAAVQTGGKLASQLATMTTVGSAMNGHMPSAQDFVDGAILLGGLHGMGAAVSSEAGTNLQNKLREIYAQTGLKPDQVVQDAQENPAIKQQIFSANQDIPTDYDHLVSPPQTGTEKVDPREPPKTPIDPDSAYMSKNPVLSETLGEPDPQATIRLSEEAAVNDEKVTDVKPGEGESQPPTAQDKILDKIGEKQKPGSEPITFNKVYEDFVDKLDPIKTLEKSLTDKDELPASESPYDLSRMAPDYKSKVRVMLEHGTFDFNTLEDNGPSLKSILDPIKDDRDGFNAYVASKRALEVEAVGKESGFDLDAARTVVQEGKGKFEKASQQLTGFQNKVLKYLKDSGSISEDSYSKMVEAGKDYVPFSRLNEDETSATGNKSSNNPVKSFKGSDLKINDPVQSVLENTETYIKLAEQNRAKTALLKLNEKLPDEQQFMSKVKTPMKAIDVTSNEFSKALGENGHNIEPQDLTIFRPDSQKQLTDTQIDLMNNGKREVYEVPEDIARAIKSFNNSPQMTNLFFRAMQSIARVTRGALSFTPDFIARHFIRNQLMVANYSKVGNIPFYDTLAAMKDMMGKEKGDVYWNWMKSGGANGAFFDINKNYLEKDIFGLSKSTGLIDKIQNLVKTPLDAVHAFAQLSENGTRMAEFKKASGGNTDIQSIQKGGIAAREVSIDSLRIGAKMQALNSITAFQNAAIQGIDRTGRAFADDPKGMMIKTMASITLPSLLLYWANRNDERVQQIPRWQRDLCWIIPTDNWEDTKPEIDAVYPDYMKRVGPNGQTQINNGTIYRIPKPFELGVLAGSLPEHVMEAFFTDHPDAFKEFGDTVAHGVTPSLIPNAIGAPMEAWANKSLFTGQSIVPHSLEDQLPETQYTNYTSETAKQLGKLVAAVPGMKDSKLASPMVLDHLVTSWSGNLGRYALNMMDGALHTAGIGQAQINAPETTLADIPFVKAFVVRFPAQSATAIQDFYDNLKTSEETQNSIASLAKRGDVEASFHMKTLEENQQYSVKLNGISTAISNLSHTIQKVNMDPSMNPHDKRQLIDGLYFQTIEMAKAGNQVVAQVKQLTSQKLPPQNNSQKTPMSAAGGR